MVKVTTHLRDVTRVYLRALGYVFEPFSYKAVTRFSGSMSFLIKYYLLLYFILQVQLFNM